MSDRREEVEEREDRGNVSDRREEVEDERRKVMSRIKNTVEKEMRKCICGIV